MVFTPLSVSPLAGSRNAWAPTERKKKYPFHREKVKALLLAAEVMLLHAEVALLQLEAQP